MRYTNALLGALSLLLEPSFSYAQSHPAPPVAGTSPVQENAQKPPLDEEDNLPSNVGAVNEGGGTANTNGMNNGLSPNSSGSGTNSSRASEQTGVDLGGSSPSKHAGDETGTGTVQPTAPDDAQDSGNGQ
jgi:hypothetical protein